ncbi:MAG: beta-glucosidase, partial [Oscillospiraceae bacterium]|nr:beta-glucosidase [Oscillospiraceae bacterium]
AYNEDWKGLNVWDVFSHEPGNIANNDTGDIACDHYHRFKEDVALMRELGIKAYRFSLSWSRIFPNGTGKINEKGAKFYSDLIDELLKNGIEPYITLFHWDYPYALHKKGGWLNDESIKWFADYAAKVSELYSDRVKYFITLNEPQCFVGLGHLEGGDAPGLQVSYKDAFRICHNVLKAHGAAVIELRKNAKQPIKIGYAPTCTARYPATESAEDIKAAHKSYFTCPPLDRDVMWNVSWWSDPVILGKYPEDGLELYKEYLPEITEEDMTLISQPLDFYAQNIYNGKEVRRGADGEPEYVPNYPGFPKTGNGWPVTPECMRWAPRFLYERYKLPIYITENGMSAPDVISLDGMVHDAERIDFLNRYLIELEKAADEGADLGGYFLWSFLDNFEWRHGYNSRFGIVFVDYNTQKRIPKNSAYWYKSWIKNHNKT